MWENEQVTAGCCIFCLDSIKPGLLHNNLLLRLVSNGQKTHWEKMEYTSCTFHTLKPSYLPTHSYTYLQYAKYRKQPINLYVLTAPSPKKYTKITTKWKCEHKWLCSDVQYCPSFTYTHTHTHTEMEQVKCGRCASTVTGGCVSVVRVIAGA